VRILAIDPGTTESGYALIEYATARPVMADKVPNEKMLQVLYSADYDLLVIEMVASYGMAVGQEVFDTCVWIGRFKERGIRVARGDVTLVYRREVKLHHCGDVRAKDANITQALIDRFAPGEPNRGKGTKAAPGWFHGFRADIWQAYALAVYAADKQGE
jgi:hypothetical protein